MADQKPLTREHAAAGSRRDAIIDEIRANIRAAASVTCYRCDRPVCGPAYFTDGMIRPVCDTHMLDHLEAVERNEQRARLERLYEDAVKAHRQAHAEAAATLETATWLRGQIESLRRGAK